LPSKKPPAHKKEAICHGYEDILYSATLKKRCDDQAIFLAVNESYSILANLLPLFGPPSKKLKQITLTPAFTNFPGVESVEGNKFKAVIDLTNNPLPAIEDGKPNAIINLTTHHSMSAMQSPPSKVVTDIGPPSTLEFSFCTPPPRQKMRT
jgi:hypothetical protein